MPETINVKFANAKKEYLRSITPISYTRNILEAFTVTCDVSTVDYDWVKDNVLNTIEKVWLNDGIQTLLFWIFDTTDNDFVLCSLVYDPAGKIVGSESWDPTASLTSDTTSAAKVILNYVKDEIADIYLRCIAATKTISSTISAMAKAVGASVPTSSGASTDLDKLCESISQNTKAEIVKPKETLDDYICNNLLKTELEEIFDFF